MKHRLCRYTRAAAIALAMSCAVTTLVAQQRGAQPQAVNPASAPTPRATDGRPDLTGFWGGGGGGNTNVKIDAQGNLRQLSPTRGCHPGMAICAAAVNQANDEAFTSRMDSNRPIYRPELWEKIQDLDQHANTEDPIFKCQPYGVPRMGPPTKIVQKGDEVILLYAQGGVSTAPQDFRVIPTNAPKRDPVRAQDLTYYGYSIGHWEDETLVVASVAFNDVTWLEGGGYFHSNNMEVIEKFTRVGNTLRYDVTVVDPDVLLEPWVLTPRTLRLNPNPEPFIPEGLPCDEREQQHLVGSKHF